MTSRPAEPRPAEPRAVEPRADGPTNTPEFSVSELSAAIKRALESGFGHVRLRGEISGYRGPHASGHCYFALKDERAKIDAVVWKSTFGRLRFKPEEGMEVIAHGRITTYPGSSKYQIVVEALEPAGAGALMAILEERKRKLTAEGLFAQERKRALPFLPRVIGLITSPTGAVIRDMLHGFDERFPAHVVVWPVRVQGDGCAVEVAAAIEGFNAIPDGSDMPRPELLIVARGGGSLEDLWGFNEEIAVRAAANSGIPLIAAVGHETDWTLIDLAADARAPTPTKAAEWAVPKFSELVEDTGQCGLRLRASMRRVLETARTELRAAQRGLPRPEDLVALPRQRFDAVDRRLGRGLLANTRAHTMRHAKLAARLQARLLTARLSQLRDRLAALTQWSAAAMERSSGTRRTRLERLSGRLAPELVRGRLGRADERLAMMRDRADRALRHRVCEQRRRLQAGAGLLRSLSYQGVLKRGFALLRDDAGVTVRSIAQVDPGQLLAVEVADGRFNAQALDAGQRAARTAPARPKTTAKLPAKRSRSGDGSQGSLF